MSKKIIALSTLATLLAVPVVGLAQVDFNSPTPVSNFSLEDLVTTVLNIVWIIFVALAILMFIIAGVSFMTAQGDPEKVAQARNFVIWGAVGIVVAVLAWSIVGILRGEFNI